MKTFTVIRIVAIVLIVAVFMYIARSVLINGSGLDIVKNNIIAQPVYAGLLLIVLYIVAVVAVLPAAVFSLAAGSLFGVWAGIACVMIGASIGATVSFVIARTVGYEFVRTYLLQNQSRLSGYAQQIEQNGFLTVLILRLIPLVPFNILNYGLGITPIPLWSYVAGTVIGIIPGVCVYVYAGATLTHPSVTSVALTGAGLLGLSAIGIAYKKYIPQK
jgi:uncharacterized membrane protein YdjX (TVP38/TMEM64 family)